MSQYGYLMHHGVKGMRWGVRNYQNPDGSLTAEGKARYGTVEKYNKAMATRQKIGKVAKGIGIASAASLAAGAAIGGGIVAYQNRDKIRNAALKAPQKALNSGNVAKASKLASRVYNKEQLGKFVSRNAEKLANTPKSLTYGRTRRAFDKFAEKANVNPFKPGTSEFSNWKAPNWKAKATGQAQAADKFSKTFSNVEKGLKIIGAGTAAIGVVTGGIAAVKGIANTANNIYVTKDLPVVKEGARILNEKGYLKEDSPIYKWIIEKK